MTSLTFGSLRASARPCLAFARRVGGEGRIRTSEGVSQQIYSLPRLAASVPLRLAYACARGKKRMGNPPPCRSARATRGGCEEIGVFGSPIFVGSLCRFSVVDAAAAAPPLRRSPGAPTRRMRHDPATRVTRSPLLAVALAPPGRDRRLRLRSGLGWSWRGDSNP